jgi:predicted TIM-barrel fold metal-dependent hydrolase
MTFVINSLVHVSEDGGWFNSNLSTNLDAVHVELETGGINGALLVGSYSEDNPLFVLKFAQKFRSRYVVGAPCLDPRAVSLLEIQRLHKEGLRFVKLHPRLGGYSLSDESVIELLTNLSAEVLNPVVLVCSFQFGSISSKSGFEANMHRLATLFPQITFIAMHAMGMQLFSLIEATRNLRNVYWDISYSLDFYTLETYVDMLKFACSKFDQRVVWGSDFPEFTSVESLLRLDYVLAGLDEGKLENIQGLNLKRIIESES